MVFIGMSSLQLLNLSDSPIYQIQSNALFNLSKIKILAILNITSNIETNNQVFHKLKLKMLEASTPHICCLAPCETQCSTVVPWHLSCTDLLVNGALKAAFYFVSLSILLTNTASLTLQKMTNNRQSYKVSSFAGMVNSVNMADLSCSIPLFCLCVSDLYYKGSFATKAMAWKRSPPCYTIFSLFLNFQILSPTVLCLFSLTKFMVVKNPLHTQFKSCEFVQKCNTLIYGTCFTVSSSLTLVAYLVNTKYANSIIPMTVCSPFVDPSNRQIMTKVMTWITVILQMISTIFICGVYKMLVDTLKAMQNKMKGLVSRRGSNAVLIIQIVVVTASNVLCWIPSGTIYLTSMFMKEYPLTIIFWTTTAINPINSVVNPIVLIATNIKKVLRTQFQSSPFDKR